jgi:serine/threonine protein kinase
MSEGPITLESGTSGLEAGVTIGDFRIERRLGAGGMGIVYQARQLSLNRPVALKVLGQALTRSADVSRFQREAQAAARLKHAGIAQVYFIGQDRHLCYLAMELIDGVSLRRVLDCLATAKASATSLDTVVQEELSGQVAAPLVRFDVPTDALPPREKDTEATDALNNPYLSPQARELRTTTPYIRRACELIRDAALALAHAHEQGVIHRDIKPDNLLLGRNGKINLIDFGIARFFDDQAVTYTGQLVGTPLYMSPEQVTGRGAIDARTDIYSLGLVLYEMLALRTPIQCTNRENLLRSIVTKPLPPVSWSNPAVPPDLERIAHRATQKDADQRYATAADLAADLDRFLTGKPVSAPPYRFRLDEREIVAARPGRVVLAAFIFFVVSFFVFITAGSLALFFGFLTYGLAGPMPSQLIGLLIPASVTIAGLVIGSGILAGRRWARWIGAVSAALMILIAAAAIISGIAGLLALSGTMKEAFDKKVQQEMEKQRASRPDAGGEEERAYIDQAAQNFLYGAIAMYALPLLAALMLGGTALWGLLSPTTGRWFRFSREIRLEHRRLKEQLTG